MATQQAAPPPPPKKSRLLTTSLATLKFTMTHIKNGQLILQLWQSCVFFLEARISTHWIRERDDKIGLAQLTDRLVTRHTGME